MRNRPATRPPLFPALIPGIALALAAACSSSSHGTATPGTAPPAAPAHASGPSTGCKAAPVVKPGTTDQRISADGVERVYQLDVPASYDGTKPYALVLGLHALTVSYTFVPGMTGFADMASKYDFIGVAPSGRLDGATPYWNAAPVPDNYDVAFLGQLLDHLESTMCIDTSRIFSTGMSNGAQMSSLLACRRSQRITAIAPVSGVEFLEPCNGAPVRIIAFHGSADPILPYTGGGLNATKIADAQYYKGKLPPGLPAPLGVDESMRLWAKHNGCAPDFVEERVSPEVRKRTWQNCKAGTELYVVDGGGHAWPGKPVPQFEKAFGHGTTEIDASSLIFSFFFDRHPS
jgi:polyhydroxybutyrate depolymerase